MTRRSTAQLIVVGTVSFVLAAWGAYEVLRGLYEPIIRSLGA